jgi:hypothetical protein
MNEALPMSEGLGVAGGARGYRYTQADTEHLLLGLLG